MNTTTENLIRKMETEIKSYLKLQYMITSAALLFQVDNILHIVCVELF